MELSSLRRDPASIESGRWVSDIPGMGDLRLKVRGMSSLAYQSTIGRLSRALPKDQRQRDGSPQPAAAMRIMGEALHEAVLLDWDGLSSDGAAMPYDAARAKDLLINPEWRVFADATIWAANTVDNERQEAAEGVSKKQQPSSPGN